MRRRKQREDLVPELTPMIDVIFLLLIFFMVATVFKKDEAVLLLQLPKAKDATVSKSSKQKENLVIELTPLALAVNGKKSNFSKFDTFCKRLKDRSIPIDLRVDKKVAYEKLIEVLNVLQKYKLSNLSLVTDR